MAQTTSPKVSEIITEMANIFAIPLASADRIVHNALDNGQFVIALPFSPDASLLQVESSAPTSSPLISPSTTQTIIMKGSAKAGQAIVAGTGYTAYTVTSGKTLYINSFFIGCSGAVPFIEIRDNGSSGTILQGGISGNNGDWYARVFPTPLKFSTDVWIDVNTNATVYWGFVGFEQ